MCVREREVCLQRNWLNDAQYWTNIKELSWLCMLYVKSRMWWRVLTMQPASQRPAEIDWWSLKSVHTKTLSTKKLKGQNKKTKGLMGMMGNMLFFNEPGPGSVHQETSKAPLHLNTIYNSDMFSTVLQLAIQYCTELLDTVYVLLQCVCRWDTATPSAENGLMDGCSGYNRLAKPNHEQQNMENNLGLHTWSWLSHTKGAVSLPPVSMLCKSFCCRQNLWVEFCM